MQKYFLNIIILLLIILCFGLPLSNWGAFIAILVILYAIILNKIIIKTNFLILSIGIVFSLTIVKINMDNEYIHMGEQIYSPDDSYLS